MEVIFKNIENYCKLVTLLVDGPARNILVELAIIYTEDSCDSDVWISSCPRCKILKHNILRKLVFVAANCFIANKVKNYYSMVITKTCGKRKLRILTNNSSCFKGLHEFV